jgi:hypothetical protein
MNRTIPKPDTEFLMAATQLAKILNDKHASSRWRERKPLAELLRKKFEKAFGLQPDKLRVAQRLLDRFTNTELAPRDRLFDHTSFYRRGMNLVIVAQSYGIDEVELTRWVADSKAKVTVASEWGHYFPGQAALVLVEFTPRAKANLDKRLAKLP